VIIKASAYFHAVLLAHDCHVINVATCFYNVVTNAQAFAEKVAHHLTSVKFVEVKVMLW
jgi:hypothetical protein